MRTHAISCVGAANTSKRRSAGGVGTLEAARIRWLYIVICDLCEQQLLFYIRLVQY